MEGSLWTVITGTLSGRRGSALSFAGVADEGNSGGPVRFKGKVVGIVTEVGTKFNSAAPAVVARFVLEGWGVRLSEEGKEPPLDMVPEEREPVAVQSMARAMVAGKYQGLGFSTMGGMVYRRPISKAVRPSAVPISTTRGISDRCRARCVISSSSGARFQVVQGVYCDFVSDVGAGGKTIQGYLTCNNGNSGFFALERQETQEAQPCRHRSIMLPF